jgi:hypothetical protein
MKNVAAWLTAPLCFFGIAIAAASSCSINHKSSEYECALPSDCDAYPGRSCVNGFCVTSSGPIDAPPTDTNPPDGSTDGGVDAGVCPPQCTSCRFDRKECIIDCATTSCNSEVVCPTGWNCTIGCSTTNSCTSGIDCSNSLSCTVVCSGNGSCRDLECGEGKCNVTCSGKGSCREMDCSDSCACDISCAGGVNAASCEGNTCPFGCPGLGFGRCSSAAPGCNTCQ